MGLPAGLKLRVRQRTLAKISEATSATVNPFLLLYHARNDVHLLGIYLFPPEGPLRLNRGDIHIPIGYPFELYYRPVFEPVPVPVSAPVPVPGQCLPSSWIYTPSPGEPSGATLWSKPGAILRYILAQPQCSALRRDTSVHSHVGATFRCTATQPTCIH